jgi:cytochrome c oxidase assembly protein subunit 15
VAGSPSLRARWRALDVAPRRMRQIALWAALLLYLVVTTGAVVRLTGSGLGCENWPRCGEAPFPTSEVDAHAVIEFGNRVIAFFGVIGTIVAWIAATKTRGLARWVKRVAFAAAFGTFFQIPLGGITVISGLHPVAVMQHFLLALVVFGLSIVLLAEARALETGRASALVPRRIAQAGLVLLAACAVLVVTGAFATASGPHPGDSSGVGRIFTPEGTIEIHVVATAIFGVLYALTLAVLAWQWRRSPRLLAAAAALLVLFGGQMAVGEIQYNESLPWWIVLIHVCIAAAIWGWTVGLVHAFWRPVAGLAPTARTLPRVQGAAMSSSGGVALGAGGRSSAKPDA